MVIEEKICHIFGHIQRTGRKIIFPSPTKSNDLFPADVSAVGDMEWNGAITLNQYGNGTVYVKCVDDHESTVVAPAQVIELNCHAKLLHKLCHQICLKVIIILL